MYDDHGLLSMYVSGHEAAHGEDSVSAFSQEMCETRFQTYKDNFHGRMELHIFMSISNTISFKVKQMSGMQDSGVECVFILLFAEVRLSS